MSKKVEKKGVLMIINIILNKLVQRGYDKNDILCIGKKEVVDNSQQSFYIVVIPTLEQLFYKENIEKSIENLQIINVQNICKWYYPKAKRNIVLLQHEKLISDFLSVVDTIWSINPTLITNENLEIRHFLLQLFNQHNNEISLNQKESSYIDKDIFLNQLTHAEHNALKSIMNEIGSCGNISISKMIQKYTISRPVWTNLLKKMQEFSIGEIVNQGVKGTYINITHPELMVYAADICKR